MLKCITVCLTPKWCASIPENKFVFSLSVYPQKTNKENISWQNLIDSPNPNYYEIKEAFDKQWKDKNYQKGEGIQLFRRWEEFMLKHMDINGSFQ